MMNKIERAIYDTKLRIKGLENDRMVILAQLKTLNEQLDSLEAIERDKSTPHVVEPDKTAQGPQK